MFSGDTKVISIGISLGLQIAYKSRAGGFKGAWRASSCQSGAVYFSPGLKAKSIPVDVQRVPLYTEAMIRSFRSEETEKIFNGTRSLKLPQDIQKVAYRKLRMLHQARVLQDLAVFPGNHLEKLKGGRSGQYSIRVNEQWRICFEWLNGDAFQVEIVDYHQE